MDSQDDWAEWGWEAARVKVSRGRVLKGLESQARELGFFPRPEGSRGEVWSGARTWSGWRGLAAQRGADEREQ